MHRMEYYLALKREEILTHATKWINIEDITLNEISHTQKDMYYSESSYIKYLEYSSPQRQEVEWWLLGDEEREEYQLLFNGY